MNQRRQPSLPPKIPGFQYVGLLGMGGFADVFEYLQEFPRRPVAVKVLLPTSVDEGFQEGFFAEANIMAGLSQHPSIVAIHQAAIAADGRPYFVMEYCARPNLGARFRNERISVAEVLRTGIRVASAVETAHRSGVLHRDIKPANILATDFGWPALTDFGIAGAIGDKIVAAGMSIPWAPPELLREVPIGDARSDVYSLAATLYTLLAGRSPFEKPRQSNSPLELIARIEKDPPPPIERVDVPIELNAILARGMQKHPDLRFPSALALAHALQQIERKMQLPVTGIDIPEVVPPTSSSLGPVNPQIHPAGILDSSAGSGPIEDEDEATRLRSITSINPDQSTSGHTAASEPEADRETRLRPITSIPAQQNIAHAGQVNPNPLPVPSPPLMQPIASHSPKQPAGPPPAPGATTGHPQLTTGLNAASGNAGLAQHGTAPGHSRLAPAPGLPAPNVRPRQFKPEDTADPGYFKSLRHTAEQTSTPRGQHVKTLVSIVSLMALFTVLFFVGKNILGSENRDRIRDQEVFEDEDLGAMQGAVPSVTDMSVVRSGTDAVTFAWTNPNPQTGDYYVWRIITVGQESQAVRVTEPEVAVPLPADQEPVCIEVSLVRENGKASTNPTKKCS